MNEDQFLRIYHEHLTAIFTFVARRVGDERALVEDVVQETWLRAVRAWMADGAPASPSSWLRTVARNLIHNHFRAMRPETLSFPELEACLETGPDAEPEALRLLSFGLARLRPSQAALLESFHVEGKAVKTIAAEAGLSERAVEGRLHRARRDLRARLEGFVAPKGDPS